MKKWIIGTGVVVLALAIGLAGAYWFFTRGYYSPGMVRAETSLRDPLTPPAGAAGAPDYWQVSSDIRLYHFSTGQGEDVLFLHGGPATPPYKPFPGIDRLGKNYRIHFYHQRGCGFSTRPIQELAGSDFERVNQAIRTLGIQENIADVERIRRILGRERITLIGHSFGGFLAMLYALEFPERVKALVLIAPANLLSLPPSEEADLYTVIGKNLNPAEQKEFMAYRDELMNFGRTAKKSDAELTAFNNRFIDFYAKAGGLKDVPESMSHAFRPEGTGGWAMQAIFFSLGARYDYRSRIKELRIPTLVLHGKRDLIPEETSAAVAALIPGARLHLIENAGHMPFANEPEEFAQTVTEFLRTVR